MRIDDAARNKYLRLGEGQRDGGVVVTAAHDDGRATFHVKGPSRTALIEACGIIDSWGGGWNIVSISTPRTIYRDLQGSRFVGGGRRHDSTSRVEAFVDDPRPECSMLAAVGRLDLLRPLPARR